ncbi:hypothetical protein [uncultured Flavobacterium sp.]|uniref:hypothetical protein n=1 Tax=uncultured Flavobacterium sp. TaxID=165435 RepID=UPI0025F189C3|nr:hypothetical protein [uncultured Flavobacterium sp.]
MESKSNHTEDNKNSKELDRLIEKDRVIRNAVPPDYPIDKKHNGSQELVDKYNINDKAYSDSSKDDFVETVSKFRHSGDNDIENSKKTD